ncbi:MAG: hypothetical protein ABSF59_01330 [Candidatus Sulfotelmatobacter sp.]
MSRVSPTLEGFRATFRVPSLTFAEIAWRWTIGATASALTLYSFFEYLDSLPVTHADATLLSTRQPALIGRAIAHIFHGSLSRAVVAALLGALALSFLWIIAASLGRSAILRGLVEHFRSKFAEDIPADAPRTTNPRPLRVLAALNFLRVALGLATILAVLGAALLAGFASSDAHPKPGLVFFLFVPLAGFIGIAGWGLNWLLSLAPIFAVRDNQDALGAISAAVTFARDHVGAVLAVSTWTGLAHFVAFSVATTAVSIPLTFLQIAPWRAVVAVMIFMTLIYFAFADWLYMARLAGYVCIAEMPAPQIAAPVLLSPILLPPDDPAAPRIPIQTTIDRDEPILSDLPGLANLAVET